MNAIRESQKVIDDATKDQNKANELISLPSYGALLSDVLLESHSTEKMRYHGRCNNVSSNVNLQIAASSLISVESRNLGLQQT